MTDPIYNEFSSPPILLNALLSELTFRLHIGSVTQLSELRKLYTAQLGELRYGGTIFNNPDEEQFYKYEKK